jgi:ATP-dependent RNA helicase DDX47/RRP3
MAPHAKMPGLTKRKRKEDAPASDARTSPKKVRSDKSASRPAPPPAPESDEDVDEEIPNPTNGDGSETATDEPKKTFADLGIREELVDATAALGYKYPTPVCEA